MPSDSSEIEEEDFTLIVPKGMKPLQAPELQKALTLEQYRSYSHCVYSAQITSNRIIGPSGIYARIHFLAGSQVEDVTKAVFYGYCGNVTGSPGNREILGLHKSFIEAVKKFQKSSRSDMVMLKFLTASREVYLVPTSSWIIV